MGKLQLADVENEYKKFPDLKREDVQKIREWMEKQPHLPKISELEAILFLHSNYYKMEATKTAIEAYYTLRSTVPMFFTKRSAQEPGTKRAIDTLYGTILPKPTIENHVVVYGALKDFDTANFDIGEIFKLMIGVTDVQFLENGAADGYRIVIDMKGVTFGHVGKLSVAALKNFLVYLQDAMPIRLKGLHFASVPSFMDIVLGLLKPFMKKELMGMLYLHPTYEHMIPYFGKECLPSDCGGESESREELTEKCFGHIKELHDYFVEEEETRRIDESKRAASKNAGGGLSGIMGSFRKLDID
ncbi:clavesin-1 isoform X1 [Culex pipiens pallens]|uniref:clavesin-1 isoform X1 n=1 Tax=Culex pipiens pallens TaxID=42434 RepID=UPI001954BA39|nr:clavesin-1 isoform X1 [Culex pipiens pallens]